MFDSTNGVIMSKPLYSGYRVKCRRCKCVFIAPLEPTHGCAYPHYRCPHCDKRIGKRFWWRKI